MQSADLVVTGRVLTMDAARTTHSDGAVAVRGSRILAVGPRAEIEDAYKPVRTVSRPHAIVMPGFIDCHTHLTQALVRGLVADELPMIYRLYTPATMAMSPEEGRLAATLCCAQLLRAGVTTVCEGSVSGSEEMLEAVLDGVQETGIRCNVVRGRADQEFHHAPLYTQATDRSWLRRREGEAERDLLLTEALLARFPPNSDALLTAGVCASSLLGFSVEYFAKADALARRHGAKLHVHAARDREEVEICLAVAGRRPIEWLDALGVVGPHLVVAHAMLASATEIRLLGAARAAVAHSPIECVNILNGIPDIPMLRALGATVGLGCDNAANDMFSVMLAAWLIHGATRGLSGYDPAIMPAEHILAMASIEAARLLGLEHVTGSLEPGKQADLVVLDGSSPHLRPTQHLPAELVRYGSRGDVRMVFVAGRAVVEDGAILTLDTEALGNRAEAAAARLKAIVEPRRYRPLCRCC